MTASNQPVRLDDRLLTKKFANAFNEKLKSAKTALDSLCERTCKGAEYCGWLDWPAQRGYVLEKEIRAVLAEKERENYDCVVVVGIGGSYLGARAVYASQATEFDGDSAPHGFSRPIYFVGQHLDSKHMDALLKKLENKNPLVNVISKSGTTLEPALAFRLVRDLLIKRFGEAGANRRIIATTDAHKGVLRELALANNWPSFVVPDDVGGRFSVLTAVGLLPLMAAGLDVKPLLEGADLEFSILKQQSDVSELPAVRYAAGRQVLREAGCDAEFLAYTDPAMSFLIEWWKQLFGESEGKNRQGILPAGLLYSTDLHSMGQLVQDGKRNIFETFLRFDDAGTSVAVPRLTKTASLSSDGLDYLEGRELSAINQTVIEATIAAHSIEGELITNQIFVRDSSVRSVGQLIAFFETSCAISALVSGVNPFDQPGVEAYKKRMFELLKT